MLGGAPPAPSAKSTTSGGSKSSSRSATPVHGSSAPATAVEEQPSTATEMTPEGTLVSWNLKKLQVFSIQLQNKT